MKSSSPYKGAFTLLEVLLALGIFSLLIFVFLEILMITSKELSSKDLSDTGEEYIIDIIEEEFYWAEEIYLISSNETNLKGRHFNFILYYKPLKKAEHRYVSYYFDNGNLRRWAENYNSKDLSRVLRRIDFSGNIIARNVSHMDGTGFLENERAFRLVVEKENGKRVERIIDLSLKSFEDLRGEIQ